MNSEQVEVLERLDLVQLQQSTIYAKLSHQVQK